MRSMVIDVPRLKRRSVLTLGAASLGALAMPRSSAAANVLPAALPGFAFATAARINGVDCAALCDGASLAEIAVPARAHAAIALGHGDFLFVGRRPGTYAGIIAREDAKPHRIVAPLAQHRFSGHAAMGRTLVTAELHHETAVGALAIRDPHTGAVRDSWALPGIEPHEVLFADGGARLVVALGGIAKDASVKGPPLNAGHIESAIVELDAATGREIRRHVLPPEFASLSMRHLALAPDGETIVIAMQDQDRAALRPLIAIMRAGQAPELLADSADATLRFYIGSIAIDRGGAIVATTSPKGGHVVLWSLNSGKRVAAIAIPDVCGVAPGTNDGEFWLSSGLGEIVRVVATSSHATVAGRWRADVNFDNHILAI